MKVGIFASLMASERGHERNVSGHIQVPLHSAILLREAGHDVHVITNRFGPEHVLPAALPPDLPVHLVEDGRRRPRKLRGGGSKSGIRPIAFARQLAQFRAIARREKLDVLHVFGLSRSLLLAGLVKRLGLPCPVVATLVAGNLPARPGRVAGGLLRGLDRVVTATDYAAGQLRERGLPVSVIRHGVIRDLRVELGDTPIGPISRVLFWRDPNEMNGADVCRDAFDLLAPQHPDLTFDFAIRPTRFEVPGLEELAERHANVNIYRFPYEPGITLPRLVAESVLVVLPFRKLTVDPQLAIAESLDAGVPVVTTSIRSNPELVEDGRTGAIVPPGDTAVLQASIAGLLADRDRLRAMRAETAGRFRARWNWKTYVRTLENVYRDAGHGHTVDSPKPVEQTTA